MNYSCDALLDELRIWLWTLDVIILLFDCCMLNCIMLNIILCLNGASGVRSSGCVQPTIS
jgi:hypothetical protein